MRKTFTLIFCMLIVAASFAQKPEGVIKQAMDTIILDGEIDSIWIDANVYNIDKTFTGNDATAHTPPTLGASGETTWKALWAKHGIYLLLQVTDDSYWASWMEAVSGPSYKRDKPEIYFDINYVLEDGLGCQGGANSGHYQVDVEMDAEHINGERGEVTGDRTYSYAFKVTDPNYVAEYYVPFSTFVNNEGGPIDLTADIGFDVYICESDEGDPEDPRRRAVWANTGEDGNEAWANMDNCGIITFEGAEPPVEVDEINISADGNITADNQTLQVVAEVLPTDAAIKTVKWVMTLEDGSPCRATISSDGLITPLVDETIIVYAMSMDEFVESDPITVVISGQIVTADEVNYIKNGDFNDLDEDGLPVDWYGWGTGTAAVVDGVLEYSQDSVAGNIWSNGIKQWIELPYSRKDENFIFSFKAWADADRTFQCKIEDQANGWSTFGVCAAPETDGTSFWPAANMSITTEPTTYTFELTWANMAENRNIQFNWQLGDDPTKVYVDSVSIVAEADLELGTGIEVNNAESFNIYPNPAQSQLHIDLKTANTRVAIYNSVGAIMEETIVPGTHHVFDVSDYNRGLYFVKANNNVMKFIR